MKDGISNLQLAAEAWDAATILSWTFDRFGRDVAISSAFGAEGMVMIDIASRLRRDFRVFTVDTEFLFPETYNLIHQIEERYAIKIEKVYPLFSPEEQGRSYGARLWNSNPDRCCELRKVEPLRRKLVELRAWITGIRREQTAFRASAQKIEWDAKFGRVKINPIADWTAKQVWQYIHKHRLPYNPLHDRSYPSIGCTHCTRAIRPGEDARAGRWSGFEKTECGLHTIAPLPTESA